MTENNVERDPFNPELILPCRISQDQFLSTIYKSLINLDRDFPDELIGGLHCSEFVIQYEPAYYFDAEYSVPWSAKFGYEEKKQKKVYNRQTKSWENKTEYFIRWEKEAGIVEGEYASITSAAHKTFSSTVKTLNPVIARTNSLEGAFSDPSLMLPIQRNNGDLYTESEVYKSFSIELQEKIKREVHSNAKGKKQKDWTWKSHILKQNSFRVYIPTIFCFCKYSEHSFTFVINGACPDIVEGDNLPVDQEKKEIKENQTSFIVLNTCLALLVFFGGLKFSAPIAVIAALIWIFSLIWCFNEVGQVKERSQKRKAALLKIFESKDSDAKVVIPEKYVIPYKKGLITTSIMYAVLVAFLIFSTQGQSVP